jgi:hypothetical protein
LVNHYGFVQKAVAVEGPEELYELSEKTARAYAWQPLELRGHPAYLMLDIDLVYR